jgi:hypothetical protein
VEVHHASARVREDLHLDVTRSRDELLDEDRAVAERGLRLAPAALERLSQLLDVLDDAHAAPPAARRRLQHDRVAELARQHRGLPRRGQGFGTSGNHRDLERSSERPRSDLVAEQGERCGRRTDEDEACRGAPLGKRSVLGQEAVARVNAIAAARLRDPHQRLGVQVRRHRVRRPSGSTDLVRLGREAGVEREGVGRRVHAHGLHPECGRGLRDANGDLAPVADQDPLQRHWSTPCYA